jgi:hypothetical protein
MATVIVTAWTVILTPFSSAPFVLGPLGAEAEALELSEVEFVEILGRIFVGCGIVHDVRIAKGGVRPRGDMQVLCPDVAWSCSCESGESLRHHLGGKRDFLPKK